MTKDELIQKVTDHMSAWGGLSKLEGYSIMFAQGAVFIDGEIISLRGKETEPAYCAIRSSSDKVKLYPINKFLEFNDSEQFADFILTDLTKEDK